MDPFAGEETKESEVQSPNQEEQTFPGLLPSPIFSDQKNMRKVGLLFLTAGLFIVSLTGAFIFAWVVN